MNGEDFAASLEVERHDDAVASSIAALDAEEASPTHAVAVALDVLIEANQAATRAGIAQTVALGAYRDALDARYAEMNS